MSYSLSAFEPNNLQVLSEDSERLFCRVLLQDHDELRSSAFVVMSTKKHPSRSIVDRLTHEYESRSDLDGAWAVRPLELVHERDRTILVLEDKGDDLLESLIGAAPIQIERFLNLAIAIAEGLGNVHRRGLVHKDVKPANILVNQATGEVRLTGFGIASRLAREKRTSVLPESIVGTVTYMAPEQTGGE
jgi:serine/threonine protein kinase